MSFVQQTVFCTADCLLYSRLSLVQQTVFCTADCLLYSRLSLGTTYSKTALPSKIWCASGRRSDRPNRSACYQVFFSPEEANSTLHYTLMMRPSPTRNSKLPSCKGVEHAINIHHTCTSSALTPHLYNGESAFVETDIRHLILPLC